MHIAIPSRPRLLAAFILALVAAVSFPVSSTLRAQSNASQQQNATEKPYVIKNSQIANDNFDSASLLKQLFPDQDSYKKEEQRRFEILDAHWDLPIKDSDLDAH